jgi:SAM-dependent methyltransferase
MSFVETRPKDTGLFFDRFWKMQEAERVDRRTLQRWKILQPELSVITGRKALDVGAGRGVTSALLTKAGFEVAASDVSSDAVVLMKRQGIGAFVFDLEEDEFEDTYDAVFCLEVLQYLRYPEKAVMKMKRALNPGGALIISVPNEFHVLRRLGIFFGRTAWAGIQTPHIRFFDQPTARKLFQTCGLVIEKMLPATVCPPGRPGEGLAQILARFFPNLFSLSLTFILRSADDAAAG